MMTNEEILEEFYCQYFRSPNKDEFVACGGNLNEVVRVYGNYSAMLTELKYPALKWKDETFELFNTVTNEVEFVGVISDIADELEMSVAAVKSRMKAHRPVKKIYELISKPFVGHL